MDKEIGRIKKSESIEIVVKASEYESKSGIDIREYVTSKKFTGWSKHGVRIPIEKWKEFKAIIDKVLL